MSSTSLEKIEELSSKKNSPGSNHLKCQTDPKTFTFAEFGKSPYQTKKGKLINSYDFDDFNIMRAESPMKTINHLPNIKSIKRVKGKLSKRIESSEVEDFNKEMLVESETENVIYSNKEMINKENLKILTTLKEHFLFFFSKLATCKPLINKKTVDKRNEVLLHPSWPIRI